MVSITKTLGIADTNLISLPVNVYNLRTSDSSKKNYEILNFIFKECLLDLQETLRKPVGLNTI